MSNICENVLDVTGPLEDRQAFLAKVLVPNKEGVPEFSYNGTIPIPRGLLEMTSPCQPAEAAQQQEYIRLHGAGNWYDWSSLNWGVKWDAWHVQEPEQRGDILRFRFDSPWGPPTNWLTKTSEIFPTLEFTLSYSIECGEGAGQLLVHTDEEGQVYYEENELSTHDWRYEFDEAYREEIKNIQEGDYLGIIKQYQTQGELPDTLLQEALLERIKDEDLPLFIGFDWWDEDAFEERLKSSKVTVHKPRKLILEEDSAK